MPDLEKRRQHNGLGDQNGMTEFERKKQRHASGESTLSTDSVSNYIPTPPDGGYGWVIVFASFMNHVIVDGIAFTFGIFYGEFLDYFQAGKGETALVGALLSGFYLLTAPVAGSLVNKFGCRSVSISGAIIASLGFSLSTLSTNIKILSITYGVVGGIGLGLLYLPNVVSVSYYFHHRRALATGIAVCGAGVGCFIFAPVGEWLLQVYNWKHAMLLVAGVTLNGCVFGSLLRSLEPLHCRRKPPRAKNLFDRIKEGVRAKTRKRKVSENTPGQNEIIQKVQEIKQARENALHQEEMESEPSLLNSLQLIDQQTTANKETKSLASDSGIPVSLIISDMTVDIQNCKQKNVTITETYSENDCSMKNSNSATEPTDELGNGSTRNGVRCYGNQNLPEEKRVRKKVFLAPNAEVMFIAVGNRFASHECIVPTSMNSRGKLPHGVHRVDFARPLYRSDIFYSGSFLHIPEFRSQPNVTNYLKSLTTIPDQIPVEEESYLCRCIPISKAAKDTLRQMTDISLLRQPIFFIPCLANLFAAFGLFIPFVYSQDRAISLNVDPQQAAFLLSVIGITNTLGRILAGFLADLKHVNPLVLHNLALIAGGSACILNMFCVNYVLMCCFAVFFGLCIATWISLTSIVLCDLLGLEPLTNAFGLLTMTRGVATLIGSPIAGILFNETKDYNASFHLGGSMMLLGGLFCCLLHLPVFRVNKAPHPEHDNFDMDNSEPMLDI